MYIRRKVFSVIEDENGEEKYFSTTEFINEETYLQKEFGEKKEKKEKRKRSTAEKNVALIGGTLTGLGLTGGAIGGYHGAKQDIIDNAEFDKFREVSKGQVNEFGKKNREAMEIHKKYNNQRMNHSFNNAHTAQIETARKAELENLDRAYEQRVKNLRSKAEEKFAKATDKKILRKAGRKGAVIGGIASAAPLAIGTVVGMKVAKNIAENKKAKEKKG